MDIISLFCEYIPRIICVIYVTYKVLNIQKPTSKQRIIYSVFTLILMLPLCLCQMYFLGAKATVLLMGVFFIFTYVSHTEISLSFAAVLLSFGITYGVHLVTSMLIATVCNPFLPPELSVKFYFKLLGALITLLFVFLLFKIKRLRKGMPFLKSDGARLISGVLGSLMLILITVINKQEEVSKLYSICIVATLLCTALILIWWRIRITAAYKDMLKKAEIEILTEDIKGKIAQNETLEKDNAQLSKIIHKDNKIIPSLILSVEQLIISSESIQGDELKEKGSQLLESLQEVAKEREGILRLCNNTSKSIVQTGKSAIDATLNYMAAKAKEKGIEFDVTVVKSNKEKGLPTENELNTLLADLTENAIVAAAHGNFPKKVLVSLGDFYGYHMLSLFDSGETFDAEVLLSLGNRRITTHKEEGGSGIGLMTVMEIVKKHGASFAIEETTESISRSTGYKKRVSVIFDKKEKIILKTSHNDFIKAQGRASDIIFINM